MPNLVISVSSFPACLTSLWLKEIPGPKYKLNYRLIENRTPFLANLTKSVGRDNKQKTAKDNLFRVKKDKTAGPGSYKVEPGLLLLSNNPRSTGVSFHGFSVTEGSKPNVAHADKLKVKSNRALDQLVHAAKARGPPGVGHYKGTESGKDAASPLPRSLSKKRH